MDTNNLIAKITDMSIAYLPKVLLAILTLIVGFWVIKRIVKFAERAMVGAQLDHSLVKFLSSLAGIALKIMLIFSVAGMFGIATTSFIAMFSAVAFAFGMALQGNLGHLASGIMLLLFKPFKVGDLVEIGSGKTGTVNEITAFNTVLKTLDNKRIFLPNGTVTSNPITNISGQGTVGVDMTFGIGYEDDIDKARKIILDVASKSPHVLSSPETMVSVNGLGDSSVDLLIRPWCNSENYWDVWFYMHENVKKAFDENSINIPFPQMDLRVVQEATSA